MKIALIAGHDSYNMQGAVANGITENKFWNDFLEELLPYLPTNHTYKIFHRPNQKLYGYRGAVRALHKEIDHWGANLDVEFHFNAASGNVTGHEVLYYKYSKAGKKYATLLNSSFNEYLTNNDRGLKPVGKNDRGGYQLYIGKSASILAEPFFGTSEIDNYISGDGRNKLMASVRDFFLKV